MAVMGHSKDDMDGRRRGISGYGAIGQAQTEEEGQGNAVMGHRERGGRGRQRLYQDWECSYGTYRWGIEGSADEENVIKEPMKGTEIGPS